MTMSSVVANETTPVVVTPPTTPTSSTSDEQHVVEINMSDDPNRIYDVNYTATDTKNKVEPYIIPDAVSKRICEHMNKTHYVTVYAMAKYCMNYSIRLSQCTIKHVKLQQITNTSCVLWVTLYSNTDPSGEEKITIQYPFLPVLSHYGTNEVRSQLISIHHKVLHPSNVIPFPSLWRIFTYYLTLITLFVLTFVYSYEQRFVLLNTYYESSPFLMQYISSNIYGMIIKKIPNLFCMIMTLHVGEACYINYHARNDLKLSLKTRALWFISICILGVTAFQPINDIIQKSHGPHNEETTNATTTATTKQHRSQTDHDHKNKTE